MCSAKHTAEVVQTKECKKKYVLGLSLEQLKVLLLLSALVCFGCAVYFLLSTLTFLSSAESFQGTVVEIIGETDMSGGTYQSKVAYMDHTGNERIYVSMIASSSPRHVVGDRVTVFYNRNHHMWREKINDPVEIWAAVIVFLTMGIIEIVLFSVIVVYSRRKTSNKPTQP